LKDTNYISVARLDQKLEEYLVQWLLVKS